MTDAMPDLRLFEQKLNNFCIQVVETESEKTSSQFKQLDTRVV